MVSQDHEIKIHRLIPPGKENYHYIAVCSCQRFRSEPYREHHDADRKGLGHMNNPDLDNAARAALAHGGGTLKSELAWYREQQHHPLTPERDRPIWQQLADEVEHRLGTGKVDTEPLFSIGDERTSP